MNTEALRSTPTFKLKRFALLDRFTPASLSEKVKLYYFRHRSRRQLLTLSDERLSDIGLSREQALAEAKHPFWR